MRKFLFLLSFILLTNTFQSFTLVESVPDPESFANLFVEKLKTGDTSFYYRNFNLTKEELRKATELIKNDPYTNTSVLTQISNLNEAKLERSIAELHEILQKNDHKISKWIHENKIKTQHLELVKIFYALEKKKRSGVFILDNVELYLRDGENYYEFEFDEVIYMTNQWAGGRLRSINTVDKYLQSKDDYYNYPESAIDSSSAVTSETTTISTDENFDGKLSKKQKKLQKKIDNYERKVNKLYSDYYKGE